jgi:outer membrane protein OmpA-like peptidoglycan-associated protein
MTQDELREVVLAALLDYETLKKTRRLKAVKKALQGTMVATVIGSTGIMAAGQGRSNQVRETASIVASNPNAMSAMANPLQETIQHRIVAGAAHFGLGRHTLTPENEDLLTRFINQLPSDAELTIIGCTDSLGGQAYNKKLGKQRAQSVADFLASHGVKVKAISSEVSKNKHANWLARRVDIVVGSALASQANTLPPLANTQQSKIQPGSQTLSTPIDYHDAVLKALGEAEKKPVGGGAKNAASQPNLNVFIEKSAQPSVQRLQVRGVTHFAFNRHTLASAHKERLIELVNQLPKDAELTVIGRTDASGRGDYNKNLGMQRAKAVANFLASQGVKIKAVGSKVSSDRYTDWMARRVDIVIDSAQTPRAINLPPPVIQDHVKRVEVRPERRSKTRSISSIDGKRAVVIEKNVSRLIQRARDVYNAHPTEPSFEGAPGWWDNAEKVNNTCLDKTSWAKETADCKP